MRNLVPAFGGAARHIAWYLSYQLDRTGAAHAEGEASTSRTIAAATLFAQTNR